MTDLAIDVELPTIVGMTTALPALFMGATWVAALLIVHRLNHLIVSVIFIGGLFWAGTIVHAFGLGPASVALVVADTIGFAVVRRRLVAFEHRLLTYLEHHEIDPRWPRIDVTLVGFPGRKGACDVRLFRGPRHVCLAHLDQSLPPLKQEVGRIRLAPNTGDGLHIECYHGTASVILKVVPPPDADETLRQRNQIVILLSPDSEP